MPGFLLRSFRGRESRIVLAAVGEKGFRQRGPVTGMQPSAVATANAFGVPLFLPLKHPVISFPHEVGSIYKEIGRNHKANSVVLGRERL